MARGNKGNPPKDNLPNYHRKKHTHNQSCFTSALVCKSHSCKHENANCYQQSTTCGKNTYEFED